MTNIFPIDFEEKLTMAQDDYILFSDSEDGNKIKKAQYKNLKGEKGDPGTPGADGQDGTAATITVGSVTTGAAGSSATVVNSGTSSAAVLDFSIPQGIAGADGQDGADGAAATITVGTTTTLPAGSSATVTNSGTSSAAILNFGIPKGDAGVQDAKVFTLSSTSDLTNAQAAYDWYASGKEAIILYSGRYYYFKSTGGGSVYFAVNEYTTLDNTDVTSLVQKTLTLALSGTTVTSVSSWNMSLTNYNVLRTGKDYGTPYTPQYNGSPATKKYVDDSISGAIYSGSSAPATPTEGMLWYDTTNDVLKTYDGSNWNAVGSGSGDVVGPASATDGHLAVFDGATGKLIKDGGAIPAGVPSVGTEGQVLTVVSGAAAWANASGGGDVLVSTDTGNELSTGVGLWLGTESDFSSISTPDSNTLYIQYKPESRKPLPAEYQEVEYLENNGTCYINTGLLVKDQYRLESKINCLQSLIDDNGRVTGGYLGYESGTPGDGHVRLYAGGIYNGGWGCGFLGFYGKSGSGYTTNTDYKFEFSWISGNAYVKADGVTTSSWSTTYTTTLSGDCLLMAQLNAGNTDVHPGLRVYYAKFYDSTDTLVRELIPCYRIADGVIGMYDLVNDTFYTNAGTGTFTKGSDV